MKTSKPTVTVSIPVGENRTPRPGTMRHSIVAMLADATESKPLAAERLYAEYPTWNKRHVAECMRILRDDYGYPVIGNVAAGYRLDAPKPASKPRKPRKPRKPPAEPTADPATPTPAEPTADPATVE